MVEEENEDDEEDVGEVDDENTLLLSVDRIRDIRMQSQYSPERLTMNIQLVRVLFGKLGKTY